MQQPFLYAPAAQFIGYYRKNRAYRAETGHPVYFTLDAGPNVHLLYPGDIVHEVRAFIEDELKDYCEDGYVQQDWVGEGPEEM